MDTLQRISQLDDFWTREFAYYLNEHRHPGNRLSHMCGIPILIVSLVWGIARLDWRLVVTGQLVGWALQLVGHRIEGNRPALLKRPISFLMGPLMVLIEMAELVGIETRFGRRARAVVFGG
jgi:hypothetical protein